MQNKLLYTGSLNAWLYIAHAYFCFFQFIETIYYKIKQSTSWNGQQLHEQNKKAQELRNGNDRAADDLRVIES